MIDSAMYTTAISGTHVVVDRPRRHVDWREHGEGLLGRRDVRLDQDCLHDQRDEGAEGRAVGGEPRPARRDRLLPAGLVDHRRAATITQQNTTPKTVWFDDAAKTATSPNGDKLYADGAGSWEGVRPEREHVSQAVRRRARERAADGRG